MADGDQNNELV